MYFYEYTKLFDRYGVQIGFSANLRATHYSGKSGGVVKLFSADL